MTQPDTTQLHQFLVDHFSLDELETLCLHLKIKYDDLGGKGLTGKARDLVLYAERHGRLVDLCAVMGQQRSDLYRAAFGEAATRQTVTAAPPRRDRRHVERNPKQIFVSHAVADAEAFAHRLADDLQRAGYTIWIAPESIPDGQWVSAINRGLVESGIMLLVLTPGALDSPWVEMETNVAIELERAGEMRFIPICVSRGRYDPVWHAYQWVMFDRDYPAGLKDLLDRLSPAPMLHLSPELPSRRIHEKTGIELIRIPAGPFLYGSADSDEMAFPDEKPQRTVNLPEYWIGRAPVTNDQYKRFLNANPDQRVPFVGESWATRFNWDEKRRTYPTGKADHPVVLVNWDDAQAYCDWAGLVLPTEEQWEKAARGTDGRIWPWGNEPPTAGHCNFNANVGDTTPVGQYSPQGDSPYGCVDVAGNVWEWTASWFDQSQGGRVLRGGSWGNNQRYARLSIRDYNAPDYAFNDIGFRPVAPVVAGS